MIAVSGDGYTEIHCVISSAFLYFLDIFRNRKFFLRVILKDLTVDKFNNNSYQNINHLKKA